MSNVTKASTQQSARRIGILLADLGKLNTSVLKFLVLRMNTLQQTFEFEFLPVLVEDEFIQMLSIQVPISRDEVKKAIPTFLARYRAYLQERVDDFSIRERTLPTDHLIIVSMAQFNDNFYSTRKDAVAILALGSWKRAMSPPSLVEFFLTLILRQSVAFISPSLQASVHLGTKGCICDFNESLEDVRLKVLNGFVCSYCRAALQADGFDKLPDELVHILRKDWFGTSIEPNTPAGIATNLGYDLFNTKGLKPTPWESIQTLLQQEGIKQIIAIVGAIIQTILIALLIVWLGLKK